MLEQNIKLYLPMPISINTAYAWKAKRYKSPEYKKREKFAKMSLEEQEKIYKITGDNWLFVQYTFNFPIWNKTNKRKKIKDLANYEKVLSDFLAKNIEWFEDHKIKILFMEKNDSKKEFVKVEITEIVEK